MTLEKMYKMKDDIEMALRIAHETDEPLHVIEGLQDSYEEIHECITKFEYELNNDPDMMELFYETEGTMEIHFGA